jgi:hypothetical protein
MFTEQGPIKDMPRNKISSQTAAAANEYTVRERELARRHLHRLDLIHHFNTPSPGKIYNIFSAIIIIYSPLLLILS